jgi:hypothetical protein
MRAQRRHLACTLRGYELLYKRMNAKPDICPAVNEITKGPPPSSNTLNPYGMCKSDSFRLLLASAEASCGLRQRCTIFVPVAVWF